MGVQRVWKWKLMKMKSKRDEERNRERGEEWIIWLPMVTNSQGWYTPSHVVPWYPIVCSYTWHTPYNTETTNGKAKTAHGTHPLSRAIKQQNKNNKKHKKTEVVYGDPLRPKLLYPSNGDGANPAMGMVQTPAMGMVDLAGPVRSHSTNPTINTIVPLSKVLLLSSIHPWHIICCLFPQRASVTI